MTIDASSAAYPTQEQLVGIQTTFDGITLGRLNSVIRESAEVLGRAGVETRGFTHTQAVVLASTAVQHQILSAFTQPDSVRLTQLADTSVWRVFGGFTEEGVFCLDEADKRHGLIGKGRLQQVYHYTELGETLYDLFRL
ncbi:MAG: hypothetical protein QG623_67 [Patescibacteria group bacterium]|nr:hypothetical protein [Patescibacteria group bacterium]